LYDDSSICYLFSVLYLFYFSFNPLRFSGTEGKKEQGAYRGIISICYIYLMLLIYSTLALGTCMRLVIYYYIQRLNWVPSHRIILSYNCILFIERWILLAIWTNSYHWSIVSLLTVLLKVNLRSTTSQTSLIVAPCSLIM
jgi:hypothetical protein